MNLTNRKAWWKDVLKKYDRIAVTGSPRTGKSTLVRLVKDRPVISTDDYRRRSWSAVPHAVIADVLDLVHDKETPRFVVEGVQVPRTLRKGLEVDCVVVLAEPLAEQTPKQIALGKGLMTTLADWFKDHKDVPVLQAPPVAKEEAEDEDDPAV